MNIRNKLDQIRQMNESIRAEMISVISTELKDSITDVTEISENPRIFTVKMSTIKSDPFLRLSPSQYDVVEQRDAIIRCINTLGPDKALDALQELCLTGRSKSKCFEDICFHPSVIDVLKTVISNL